MKTIDKKYFKNPEKYIPKGLYCYDHLKPIYNKNKEMIPVLKVIGKCPFLDYDSDKPEGMNGYCHYLKAGDWEENGTCFLWDQVKECNINEYSDEEMKEMNK